MARVVGFFQDETGEEDMSAGYYMVSMVIHNMGERIDSHIRDYEARLRASGLADIPFHAVKLLHGHEGYEGVSAADRKRMLVAFATFVRRLPISYHVFSYTDYDVKDQAQLAIRLETDIGRFLDSRLEELQDFDKVRVFYDGGQHAAGFALKEAFNSAFPVGVVVHERPSYREKRLCQVADYLCSIELAACRYAIGDVSSTYNKFYGDWKSFRANYLKQVRRKLV